MFRVALILTVLAAAPGYEVACECAGEPGWQPRGEDTGGASADGGDHAGDLPDGGLNDPDAGAAVDAGLDAGTRLDGGADAGVPGGDGGTDACGGCPVDTYCDKNQCVPCCSGVPRVCFC